MALARRSTRKGSSRPFAALVTLTAAIGVTFLGPADEASAAEYCTSDVFRYQVLSSLDAEVANLEVYARKCVDDTRSLTSSEVTVAATPTPFGRTAWGTGFTDPQYIAVQQLPTWHLTDAKVTIQRSLPPIVGPVIFEDPINIRVSISPEAKSSAILTHAYPNDYKFIQR